MTTPPPPDNPGFWAEQAAQLALDLEATSQAFHLLAATFPRAIQQAADLGLMREQHDMATIRTVVRGEQALAMLRDAALVRIEGRLALVEAKLDQLIEAHATRSQETT